MLCFNSDFKFDQTCGENSRSLRNRKNRRWSSKLKNNKYQNQNSNFIKILDNFSRQLEQNIRNSTEGSLPQCTPGTFDFIMTNQQTTQLALEANCQVILNVKSKRTKQYHSLGKREIENFQREKLSENLGFDDISYNRSYHISKEKTAIEFEPVFLIAIVIYSIILILIWEHKS